jgi:spermidine synthase
VYAAFAAAVILAWIFLPSGIKPPQVGQLLYEKESAYGYIQVVQDGTKTELILNEGEAIHSIYDPQNLLTGGPWDYMVVAGSFRPAEQTEIKPASVAILGLAGGTAARQYTAAYGSSVQITGVEIDPDILNVAHRYFHLNEPNVHPVVADARYWLDTQAKKYDVIVMDAYRQPYIPFHLTTREFFSEVRAHLEPGGVAVVNAGRTATDYRLVDALASTMAAVYPSVFLVDVPEFSNTLIYGSTEPVTVDDVQHNLQLIKEPVAKDVAQSVIDEGRLRVSPYHSQVFTDDLAPVERLIDEIIFGYVSGK